MLVSGVFFGTLFHLGFFSSCSLSRALLPCFHLQDLSPCILLARGFPCVLFPIAFFRAFSQWLFPCAILQKLFRALFCRRVFACALSRSFSLALFQRGNLGVLVRGGGGGVTKRLFLVPQGLFPCRPSHRFSPCSFSSGVFSVVLIFAGSPSELCFTKCLSVHSFCGGFHRSLPREASSLRFSA